MSDTLINSETFIINDIVMDLAPSDIQLFDDNYVFEQSFLRSNSVYCYRSKYSDTKVVLNFPFQIGPQIDDRQSSGNNTINCIKLITELNSYPFCFIKNQRILTYISPMVLSKTSYLMFAVEELAIVQSAAASNLLFLEVTLRYFNHAPIAADFEFVDSNSVVKYGTKIGSNSYIQYEREMLQKITPNKVANLATSSIWAEYMAPKIKRTYERLAETRVLKQINTNENEINPGLDVKLYLPMILTNAARAKLLVQEDDGSFIGPDSKLVLTTDLNNIDDMALPNLIKNAINQDFRDEEEKVKTVEKNKKEQESNKNQKQDSSIIVNGKRVYPLINVIKDTIHNMSIKEDETIVKEGEEVTVNSIKSGMKEIFINYSNVSLSQLGFSIQKIEVRRRNLLVSHKIGSYKHPIVQYMGRVPARTTINFMNHAGDTYTTDDVGVQAFLTNAFQILDENRMFHPEAEAYNHIKINSLANVLLGVESALPSQNMISASADSNDLENVVYSFTQTDSEKFLEQFQLDASGARSLSKAYEDVYAIVKQWLSSFKQGLSTGKVSNISTNPVQLENSVKIFKTVLKACQIAVSELGYTETPDEYALRQGYNYLEENYLTTAKENYVLTLERLKNQPKGSGLILYLNASSNTMKLTLEEKEAPLPKSNGSLWGIVGDMLGTDVINASLPGLTDEAKKVAKTEKNLSSVVNQGHVQRLLPGAYFHWLASYAEAIFNGRAEAKAGTASILKNVKFRPSSAFDTSVLNIAALINASAETDPVSAGLTSGQKDFLANLIDIYVGSLYGQNLEDLHLEDLIDDYSADTDVLIQSTDPFFFLTSPDILGTEMIDFYNQSYGEERLNPNLNSTADAQTEPATTGVDAVLQVEYRQIKEVDFNAESFPYYRDAESNPLASDYTANGEVNSDARTAIENALQKYGYAGDEEFRRYMYKVAYLESSMGTNLRSSTGATGLFQFTESAIAGIMQHSNQVFSRQGATNLSEATALAEARKVKKEPTFKKDFQLSADMFIEYFIINGKKKYHPKTKAFDEALTFAFHNIGPGSGKKLITYLTNGTSTADAAVLDAVRKNVSQSVSINSNPLGTWYAAKTHDFKTARVMLGGKLKGDDTILPTTKNLTALQKQQIIHSPAVDNTNVFATSSVIQSTSTGAIQTTSSTKISDNKSSQSTARPTNIVGTRIAGTVKNVVDGDTIDLAYVSNGKTVVTRIRLHGLDTEETSFNDKYNEATRDWGEEAKKELGNLLKPGSKVTVNITDNDQKSLREDETTSGRLAGIVTNSNGIDPALVLLEKGLAKPFEGITVKREYNEAVKTAQKNLVGQWSRKTVEEYNKQQEAKKPASNNSTPRSTVTEEEINDGATNSEARYNTYQPFQDKKVRELSSDFTYGAPRKDIKRVSPHKGIDIRCPMGTVVVAAAGGVATQGFQQGGAGLYVKIDHGNGFVTTYMHLSSASVKTGQKVASQQPIGLSGGAKGLKNSGSSTGAHLHYEVRYKGRPIHPYSTKKPLSEYTVGEIFEGDGTLGVAQQVSTDYMSLSYNDRPNITEENTVYNEDALAEAILNSAKDDINLGLKLAVPAIKAYIVIGNENDGLGLDTLTTGSQFYELKGIQSFKLFCNNNDTPVDTAIMTIIDPSFGCTDAWTSMMTAPKIDFENIGTDLETQFKFNRALVRPGTKLNIRLGYGNDPNYLTTVFNGGIMEVSQGDNNQILTLILEGYGRELLQELKGPGKPEKLGGDHHSPTTVIFGRALQSKPIDHFGYMNTHLKWLYKDENDPEARNMLDSVGTGYSWFFTASSAVHRSRLFMNIFAPEIERVDDSFAKYWTGFFGAIGVSNHQFGYPFFVHNMTPWEICKQMEYRHPGTLFKPMIFEDRMTPFYGIKEQMYIAKDLSRFTQAEVATRLKSGLKDATTKNYFERRRERMLPVSNMHFVTSSTNLISNQIKLNSQWRTVTNVAHFDSNSDFSKDWEWGNTRIEVDDNILPWEVREKDLKLSGCHGKYASFVYGTTDLKREAETMYSGKILVTGNAKIKCGDYIFLDDYENRLSGLALVRECIHHFDPVNGFVTEITPGLYVEAAEFMYTPLWLQLMCAMKVGSSKTRLVLSSTFASEYDFVKQYLKVVQQIHAAQNSSIDDYPIEVVALYGTAFTLGALLTRSLSGHLGIKGGIGENAGKFAYTTVLALFKDAEVKLAAERLARIKAQDWYTKGASKVNNWKGSAKSKILGSELYKKIARSSPAKASKFIYRSPLVRVPTWAVKKSAAVAVKATLRSSLALAHGIASTNPIGLVLDIALMLAASWAFAKVEEGKYTRQPLLFFPLVKHGKPYQAGMTGAIRNSYMEGAKLNFERNTAEVSKAAAIVEGTLSSNNKDAPFLLKMLAEPAKAKQAEEREKAYIMSKKDENGNEYYTRKTEIEKQKERNDQLKEQKEALKEASK